MASLQSIVDAIDRLNEKIGAPKEAAEAMQPAAVRAIPEISYLTPDAIGQAVGRHVGSIPALNDIAKQLAIMGDSWKRGSQQGINPDSLPVRMPQTQYLPSGQPLPITAESIGISVAKHVAQITLFKDMSRHWGVIAESMKRQGPQSIPQQVLPVAQPMPGTIPLPATRRLGGPPPDISRMLSTGLSGIPVVGTIVRQAMFVNDIMQHVDRMKEAGEASKGLAAALASPAGKATLMAGSFVVVAASVVGFAKVISNANRSISGYSGQMAMAYAMSDVRDIFRDMRSAQVRAGTEAKFLGAFGNFKDAIRPVTDHLFMALEKLATGILNVTTRLLHLAGLDETDSQGNPTSTRGKVVMGLLDTVIPAAAVAGSIRALNWATGGAIMGGAETIGSTAGRMLPGAARTAGQLTRVGYFAAMEAGGGSGVGAGASAAGNALGAIGGLGIFAGVLGGLFESMRGIKRTKEFSDEFSKFKWHDASWGNQSGWYKEQTKAEKAGFEVSRIQDNLRLDRQMGNTTGIAQDLKELKIALQNNTEELRKAKGYDGSAASFMRLVADAKLPGFHGQGGPVLQGGGAVAKHHAAVARMNYGHQGGLAVKDRSHVRGAAGPAPAPARGVGPRLSVPKEDRDPDLEG